MMRASGPVRAPVAARAIRSGAIAKPSATVLPEPVCDEMRRITLNWR